MAGRSVTDLPAPSLTRHRKWWGLLFVAPAVLFFAVFAINAFQAFVLQYEMTPDRGGPADANLTLGLLILKYGFQYFRMGEAAAASVLLFAVILLVTAAQLWLGRQK
ncbi:hypothetical protein U8C32_12025 [Sinorhizobium medicae]|uniref:hypothetical protein n=1 Tax=Sinorhizobium medicae TaxID=110321 RepID=UPI002AF6B486|nr:hypothetical protein [Sinorhizobium medicae]WQO44012.1 hypothetical protein U8C42_12180 [Sinorhizobium medicae]WQO67011.1 hypothetical protein U8C40_07730 [Sinorhizobium medicae]WQO71163.1 hypothetical protein U8C31_12665 [Sinorhizobium medicae]WQO90580.1 hypothetical protein U8C32_12025 [Sinorhizobium medicae]